MKITQAYGAFQSNDILFSWFCLCPIRKGRWLHSREAMGEAVLLRKRRNGPEANKIVCTSFSPKKFHLLRMSKKLYSSKKCNDLLYFARDFFPLLHEFYFSSIFATKPKIACHCLPTHRRGAHGKFFSMFPSYSKLKFKSNVLCVWRYEAKGWNNLFHVTNFSTELH